MKPLTCAETVENGNASPAEIGSVEDISSSDDEASTILVAGKVEAGGRWEVISPSVKESSTASNGEVSGDEEPSSADEEEASAIVSL